MTSHAPSKVAPSVRVQALRIVAALIGYAVVTAVVMWPALSNNSTTVMGDIQPNDATAGGVWLAWQLQSLTPFATHTLLLNAPFGTTVWQTTDVTALSWILPLWLFTHVVGSVGAWNLDIALGYVLDGMAMFLLVRWLVRLDWIAFVAGALYAFSAFHLESSYAHIGYVYSWIFPLILWAGLSFAARPTTIRGITFGFSVGIAAYVDGYYIIFAPLFGAVLAASTLIWIRQFGTDRGVFLRRLIPAAVAYGITIVPVAIVFLDSRGGLPQTLSRSLATIYFYGARPWEYVVPWNQSPLWGFWSAGAVSSLLTKGRGSGVLERTLYLGGGVMLLTVALAITTVTAKGFSQWRQLRLPARPLGRLLSLAAVITLLCSFSTFGPIPGFPVFVWYVEPFWRVYSRLFVVVDCLVIVTTAIMLAYVAQSKRHWLAPILAVLTIADGCAIFPWSSWSYTTNSVAAYKWLAAHQDGGIVAAYPVLQPPKWAYEYYLAYQPYTRHPFFNGAPIGSQSDAIERGLADLNDPQSLPGLKHFGVRYIILNTNFYAPLPYPNATLRPAGLRPIISTFHQTLYRFGAVHPIPGMITVGSGFYQEMVGIPHMHRWMSDRSAKLGILPFEAWKQAKVSFLAQSYKKDRSLTVTQNGVQLWHGHVSQRGPPTHIAFTASRHGSLVLHVRPGAAFVPGFTLPHYFSVNIFGLSLSR